MPLWLHDRTLDIRHTYSVRNNVDIHRRVGGKRDRRDMCAREDFSNEADASAANRAGCGGPDASGGTGWPPTASQGLPNGRPEARLNERREEVGNA